MLDYVANTQWLRWRRAVAKRRENHWNRTADCMQASTEGMTKPQRKFCSRNLELMSSVVHASLQTAQVCQELFLDSRWNCSSILLAPNFMPDLNGGKQHSEHLLKQYEFNFHLWLYLGRTERWTSSKTSFQILRNTRMRRSPFQSVVILANNYDKITVIYVL